MRRITYLGWGLLLVGLILSGCGKLERSGNEPENIPPQVSFANVPAEDTEFSVNPQIYWYGTDTDGYITAYQYAVIRDSTINEVWGGLEQAKQFLAALAADSATWVNSTIKVDVFGSHVTAERGHQRGVRLYAAEIETIYTAQHVFLRAVDNAGGISEIKTRMYRRNNHAPEIYIDVDSTFVENNFYCLPDTIRTWKGIEISWHGLDTLDYPDLRKQPDFYYKWELRGPYRDTLILDDPNAALVDSSLDSIVIEGEAIYDRWILDKFHVFKNLDNYQDAENLGYGWYLLRIWSRDDAFVKSKDSATAFFRILKPLFLYEQPSQKSVLVLDHTTYEGDGGAKDTGTVWPFYREALSQTGLCDKCNIHLLGEQLPPEDSLSRYDLVIALNLGNNSGISEASYAKYKRYLNVGGRVWFIGMKNYGVPGSRGVNYLAVALGTNPNILEVSTTYCGVEGVFLAGYSPAFYGERLEFKGATPFGGWDLPLLEVDSVKTTDLMGYDPEDPGKNFPQWGVPHVPYVIIATALDYYGRAPIQRRLYSFVSRRLTYSPLHQMPCAVNYIGPTYRTATFCFPLNVMKDGDAGEPGALKAFQTMVEWFWQDMPQP
jgi:hypothetical protein